MTRVLVLFLDGLGLGEDDPSQNPLCVAQMPALQSLLDQRPLNRAIAPYHGRQATLLALDATMGVEGLPQSATGQAILLTGRNVAAEIGRHYGPKPNPLIADIIREDNIFIETLKRGKHAALLNAYPPQYFSAIERGRRLYSAIPLALTSAGIPLRTSADLQAGHALSADFSGQGWNERGDFPTAPLYSLEQAGALLAHLAQQVDLAWFDYWLTDYAGHRAGMQAAVTLLEQFDQVLAGLLAHWQADKDVLMLVSDHGNLEDLNARGHTYNPVPLLLVGPNHVRQEALSTITDIRGVHALMRRMIGQD